MCFLANPLTTSRAGLAGSTALSFGCGKPHTPLLYYDNGIVRRAIRFAENAFPLSQKFLGF